MKPGMSGCKMRVKPPAASDVLGELQGIKNEWGSVNQSPTSLIPGLRIKMLDGLGARCVDQIGVDLGEDVADDGAQDQEDGDDYDSDQNENESIFNKTLTFFLRGE